MKGICPNPDCRQLVMRAEIEQIALNTAGTPNELPGVSYICPNCSTVLGVSINPVALDEELVRLIKEGRN